MSTASIFNLQGIIPNPTEHLVLGLRLINLACPQTAVQTLIGPKNFKCKWVCVCMYVLKTDTYIRSSSWAEGRQQTKQWERWPGPSRWKWAALPTRAAYQSPALQSHQGGRRKEEREQEGCRGRGGEERKGAFETTGSMCYHQQTALGNEQGHCGLLVVSNDVGDKH